MTTFVTGATGFLGATLVAELLERGDTDVVVLVRATDDAAAAERIAGALRTVHGPGPVPGARRLRAVAGDLTAPGLGLSRRTADELRDAVEVVVHSGASISFDLPLDEARAVNVGGTSEVLTFCTRSAVFPRLVHVSTAYVAGRLDGTAPEDGPPSLDADFRNTYERTKAEAERLVVDSGIPAAIARPSIVVGERGSGWTSAFNVLYWPLRAFARGLMDTVPADPDGLVDAIGVDAVVAGLLALHDTEDSGVHTLAAGPHAVTVAELSATASALLGRPEPRFAAADLGDHSAVYVPYFDVATRFATDRGHALLEGAGVELAPVTDELPALLDFAAAARWGKRPLSRAEARERVLAADRAHAA